MNSTTRFLFVGQGMRGGAINAELDGDYYESDALIGPGYRMFSVAGIFPALVPPTGAVPPAGAGLGGEIHVVPTEVLAERVLPAEPPELELGFVALADGRRVLGMLLRRDLRDVKPLVDITDFRGWRAYLETLRA